MSNYRRDTPTTTEGALNFDSNTTVKNNITGADINTISPKVLTHEEDIELIKKNIPASLNEYLWGLYPIGGGE